MLCECVTKLGPFGLPLCATAGTMSFAKEKAIIHRNPSVETGEQISDPSPRPPVQDLGLLMG